MPEDDPMRADEIRTLFDYHFAVNRKVWDQGVSQLSDAQWVQEPDYSVGSVRNQLVHMIDTDRRWFSGLHGDAPPPFSNPVHFGKSPERVLAYREETDALMRAALEQLDDDAVGAPYPGLPVEAEVWQILFHVLGHGIDHRAQLLAALNQLGVETFPQDYALYLFRRI